ncbi:MAG: ABC transporter permease [Microbacterium sp.]
MTTAASASVGAPGTPRRYLHSLWLLSSRDLRVRYATSWLGYLWSVLDPLVMTVIYWFVFTRVFHRVGPEPYIVFLISAMLPWMWFKQSINDFTTAFSKDGKLVRSTNIPRSIWVNRIVLSKGIEFLCSIPVIVLFAVFGGAQVHWQLILFPVAIVLQGVLLVGMGLVLAPLCTLFSDLERTTKLILRALFYATPIIYSIDRLPGGFETAAAFNPLAGIVSLYRVGFFPEDWNTLAVTVSAVMSVAILALGVFVFRRLEPAVLKEL